MIVPNTPQNHAHVADHYDELDAIYRGLWGEHVHHGLWRTGRETPEEAVVALSELVWQRLEAGAGAALADIGCGYGATAALFAERHGAAVTGFTLSQAQGAVAQARGTAGVTIHVRDWLENGLLDGGLDGAYAIESTEHIADKPRLFAQAARALKPGGRLVVCAWLAGDRPSPWQVRHLLEPICREGALPGMGDRRDYLGWAKAAGLSLTGYDDISRGVARTWTICAGRFARLMATDPSARARVMAMRNRQFALSVPRLMLAYRTGAMRYGVFRFVKQKESAA